MSFFLDGFIKGAKETPLGFFSAGNRCLEIAGEHD